MADKGSRPDGKTSRVIKEEGRQSVVVALLTILAIACAIGFLWKLKDIGTDPQVVVIPMDNGHAPQEVTVEAWRPVELRFRRTKAAACVSIILTDDLGMSQRLALSDKAIFEFTPTRTGDLVFSCPMNCLRGIIHIKEPA